MNLKKHEEELLFLPLGGSGEIGMNLNLYHLDGKWIIVDCGVGFADDYYPGADLIVPDISFLRKIKQDVIGMIITHAHEDHVGAVQYLWPEIECPIYTTKFTASFLKLKLLETHFHKRVKIHEIRPNQSFTLGPFEIEPINLTHSIPEMHAMAIKTKHGTIMHTGDWKFDEAPQIGPVSNYSALKKHGKEGVLALVCDSTNVFSEGESGSEEVVRQNLVEIIKTCKNRVAVGTFASNLARVETILYAAKQAGREVVVCGRSFWRLIEAAKESGYLKNTPKLWTEREFGKVPRNKCLMLITGSQAEPRAALTRISEGTHPNLKLLPNDTVILSSKIIPGNETKIFRMLNLLCLSGIEVMTEKDHKIHVSGHPYRNELKRMYEYVKPKIAIPVHGEARHIHEHAKFAHKLGVTHAIEIKNGDLLRIAPSKPEKIAVIKSGRFAIDGFALHAGDSDIMKERRKMRSSGAIFVSIVVNKKGEVLKTPTLNAPGLLDNTEDKDLILDLTEDIESAINGKHIDIAQTAKKVIKKSIRDQLDKNPFIAVHITIV